MIDGTAFGVPRYALERHDHPKSGMLKVINLWAGPGSGKSTLAAALFNVMKRERFSVEIIPEVAKAMTYEHAMSRLDNQLLVLAKQEHQLRRLIGQVEYVIVDSPFPMGLVYCKPEHVDRYQHLIDCLWSDYDNYDFFLQRTSKAYQQFGRGQTEQQARDLDLPIWDLWADYSDMEFDVVDPDEPTAEYELLDAVLEAQGLPILAAQKAQQRAATPGWHNHE